MEIDVEKILKEMYGSFTDEQKEKVKSCKTADDFMKFAEKEGLEIPDDLAAAVAGGAPFRFPRWSSLHW